MTDATSATVLDVGPMEESQRGGLEERGHVVISCPGLGSGSCPLVEGRGCGLVNQAAGIIFRLDLDDPYHRKILQCYRRAPGRTVPIQVHVDDADAQRFADDLEGTTVVTDLTERELDEFSAAVTTADLARRALSDLVGPRMGSQRMLRAEPSSDITIDFGA